MFNYEKRLEYPIHIKETNPKLAKAIITQYGGPYTGKLQLLFSKFCSVNANKIFFRDVAYTAVQIGADGYGVTSAGIGKDEKVIGSSILTWGTGVIYGGPTLGDKGSGYGYLFGPPNTVVTGLSIRWKIVKS